MKGVISAESGMSLADIIQMLCQNKQEGCLFLTSNQGDDDVEINISKGKVLNIESQNSKDHEALVIAIGAASWSFEFKEELKNSEDRIKENFMELLMNCAVDADSGKFKKKRKSTQSIVDRTFHFSIQGDQIEGSSSEKVKQEFKQEADYMMYYAKRIGEQLGMDLVSFGAFVEGDKKFGVQEEGNGMKGIMSHEKEIINLPQLLKKI